LAETIHAYERMGSYEAAGRVLGITGKAVRLRFLKAGHPLKSNPRNPRNGGVKRMPRISPEQVADRETGRLSDHLERLRAETVEVEGQIRKWETVKSALASTEQEAA
jgi:hypothetical protein